MSDYKNKVEEAAKNSDFPAVFKEGVKWSEARADQIQNFAKKCLRFASDIATSRADLVRAENLWKLAEHVGVEDPIHPGIECPCWGCFEIFHKNRPDISLDENVSGVLLVPAAHKEYWKHGFRVGLRCSQKSEEVVAIASALASLVEASKCVLEAVISDCGGACSCSLCDLRRSSQWSNAILSHFINKDAE